MRMKLFDLPVSKITMVSALLITLLSVPGCKKSNNDLVESISDIQKRDGIPVRVQKVHSGVFQTFELLGGTAEGYFQTTLTSGISGKILSVNYRVGDAVQVNTSLMTLEPDGPQNYNLVKQQLETTRKSRDRLRALAEQGGVSQEIVDQVESAYSTARDGLDAIRKSQFVPAPFSGTIVNIYQTVNNKISSGANLLTIADLEKIRIPLIVSDVLVNKFRNGQVAIAFVGKDTLKGTIEKVSLSGQEATHTFIIDAVFNNARKIIKPAMYVPVKVITESKNNAITIPFENVLFDEEKMFVYTIVNGTSRKKIITTGERSGDDLEILSGLNREDTIITGGSQMLSDGVRVKVIN